MTRIAIIDDHPLICEGFLSSIDKWGKAKVVLVSHSAEDYIEKAQDLEAVDIAIVDRLMPGMDGFQLLDWIRVHQAHTKTIMVSFDYANGDVRKALGLGARAAIHKNNALVDVVRIIESVSQTGYYTDEFMHKAMSEAEVPTPPGAAKILESLTVKEAEVLQHICDPDTPTYKVIGDRMGIKESTVHTIRRRLFEKFGITSKLGLFKLVADWKLFRPLHKPKQ